MTNIHALTEHSDQFDQFIEEHVEDPDEWAVLVGGFSGEYNVTAPEADQNAFKKDPEEMEEDPFEDGGNGLFEIGSCAFAGDAFADDADPVYEYGHSDTMRTAFMQTLIVHRSILSEEVIENVFDDEKPPEAEA